MAQSQTSELTASLPVPESFRKYIDPITWGEYPHFLLSERDSGRVCSYIGYMVAMWDNADLYGRGVWQAFRRDFEDWDADLFNAAGAKPLGILRDYLYDHGVYVSKDRDRIAPKLVAIIDGLPFHYWTQEEIDCAQTDSQIFDRLTRDNIDFIPDIVTPSQRAQMREAIRQRQRAEKQQEEEDQGLAQLLQRQLAANRNISLESPRLSPRTSQSQLAKAIFRQQSPQHIPQDQDAPSEQKQDIFSHHFEQQPQSRYPPTQGWQQNPPIVASSSDTQPSPRQLTDLAKLLTDDMRYSGEMYDVFDLKLRIFRDNCDKVGITAQQLGPAFSIMLRGKAATFYFQRICGSSPRDFASMTQRVRNHFENEESRQNYLTEWQTTTFHHIAQSQPDKTKIQVLETLIERLTIIQQALPSTYQSDEALRSQLLNACSRVKECSLCLYSPSPTLEGVCNQLRSAISTTIRINDNHQYAAEPSEQYWVDRTYRGQGRGNRYSNKRGKDPPDRKCYICKKSGCWSTKHSTDERNQAYKRFRNNHYVQDTSSTGYGTFLARYEGLELCDDESEFNGDNEDIRLYLQGTAATDDNNYDKEDGGPFYLSTTFFSKTEFNGKAIASYLADQSVRHQLTKEDLYDEVAKETASTFTLDRYSSDVFQGILPDTGAAGFSTAGHPQVLALQRTHPSVGINTSLERKANIRFGSGDLLSSSGTITVPTPFGPIDFHVVPANTPFLLCLADMDRLQIRFDNLANTLQQGTVVVPIVRKWGHPWMLLGPPERSLAWNHLTDVELRRLHRRFGHPSVQRLRKVLHEAGHDVETAAIEHLTKYCHHCQMHSKSPNRFKFTLRDDCSFNYEVIVDIVYLDGDQPVLHVVDSATSFNAACFLKDISAKTTWEALRLCWIDVYQGPPDWIVADAGRNFTAADFRREARAMAIEVKIIPIEAHHSIGKVERYHAILRRAYDIIRKECPSITRESALQSAVKSINDTAGPDGIVPTLLVFGAYPRMTDDSAPSPDVIRRAAAVRKAGEDLRKHYATRQINEALEARNGPNTTALKSLPIGSQVRVWREKKGWTGPYRLLAMNDENYTIDINGPRNFRSTVVKPYHAESDEINPADTTPDGDDDHAEDTIVVATSPPPRRTRGRPRKNPIANALLQETDVLDNPSPATASAFISAKEEFDNTLAKQLRNKGIITTPGEPFEMSTRTEIDSLITQGVFEFVAFDPTQHNSRIFKSRIVNEIKGKNTDTPYEKSRLVIQGYSDDGKDAILTQAPTIQRASQRLILALAPSLLRDDQQLWLRDITQAYVQSTSQLNRTIYAHLPTQICHRYPKGTIMKVVKPLYGIAEAGTHWWATYNHHHRENLEMITSSYDPCLLLSSIDNPNFGLIGMQTDDTIGLTDAPFSAREDEELTKAAFTAKTKQYLTADEPLIFNGGIVSLTPSMDTAIILQQKGQGKKLQLVKGDSPTAQQEYVQQRARGAYIASICQPEACYDLSAAAQHKELSDDAIKSLNRRLRWQMDSLDRGLTFVPLDLATAKLFVFVDGSFANNHDLTSQLGFVVILANEAIDEDNSNFTIHGNIVHFSSTKSKRVTRSVLASEVYGMVAGVDMAYAISSTLTMITQRLGKPTIPTIACTDSYSLYECLVKLGTTLEKRLMIDIMALRQSYERRELCEVRWIHGDDNPADGLTKASPNRALEGIINTNSATIRMEGWVVRT